MEYKEYTKLAKDSNPKTQYGLAKPAFNNIPPVGMMEVGGVMKLGGQKYGPMNWRHDKVSASTYYDAILRHLFSWWDGQDDDPESQKKHLAHVAACAMLLIDAEFNQMLIDDRPKAGGAAEYIKINTKEI